jgi:glutamine amidotransferase
MKVVIIDYGLGNLRSVAGAVQKVGYEPIVSNLLDDIEEADKLILPGVGAFGDGMLNLRKMKLVDSLTELVKRCNKPILGICLGAQLMAQESCEFGHHSGLEWVPASVVKFEFRDRNLRIPHVGWNEMCQVKKSVLMDGVPADALFYYVHSFWIKCHAADIVLGECEYGQKFTSAFQCGNIYGTQFHPEKSQLHGLTVLKNFLEKV